MSEELTNVDAIDNTGTTTEEYAESEDFNYTSWYTLDGENYFLTYTTIPHIPSGLYSFVYDETSGIGLSMINYDNADEIFLLPNTPYTEILNDLINFWNSFEKFNKYKLKPHRGILLYGESGCGKTSIIYKIAEEIQAFNGIVIQITEPALWIKLMPVLARLEHDRPIICFIKDFDKMIEKFGEEVFSLFLDGINSIGYIAYIATTNKINAIPDSIKNRPTIFDRKYEITKPNDAARKEYLKQKLSTFKLKKPTLNQIVEDTKDFNMACLRELFVSVFIFNNDYEETINLLKNNKFFDSHSQKFFRRK